MEMGTFQTSQISEMGSGVKSLQNLKRNKNLIFSVPVTKDYPIDQTEEPIMKPVTHFLQNCL